MIAQNISLYSWNNGVVMIVVFAFVCLILIGFAIKFISSENKNQDTED
ncbi:MULTISPECIES: hypothetical protein [Mesoflavibacter]|uniref:Uncharacterized protein n=1 Tax=Mesoflavibacter profundi TaxID=2708110 RepID=A0ABT4RX79_9FLAO|nr:MULTISPECIES: hypothetical protein [Mesoflavibacter]MDA0176357.1 hypothetical protein [Mesoflavibacter profundi]QIJ89997.1 hypothetical protein C7H62_2189 [Mesoflavibacter sp. HG96]QIJ92725.1 hypothetical protein C7H56_2189 [Mesoflavibacter sp. HG37]